MEDLARKIDALEQKVIASSGTMERTAKMLRLTTSSLVDAYDLPQEHFPFTSPSALTRMAAEKLKLLELITRWHTTPGAADDKKNGAQMVRDIWAKNGNAAAFPEVPPIRRHASKGTVNLVPVKDLCVVYDQQCAESICLDHLLAIMAILAGPGVYIHDVHTVPTDAKHKKRPDIVVSNQANQALLGINSALVGEVRTLHWYGERDHITQAARYIALARQGVTTLPAFYALLLTWNKVALLKGTRADQGLQGWRSMPYDIGFENSEPSNGLQLLAQVLARPPQPQDLPPSFVFDFSSADEKLELSYAALRTRSTHSLIYDVSIVDVAESAVAKKVDGMQHYERERDALTALRGVDGLVTLLGLDQMNLGLLISPQCARHLHKNDFPGTGPAHIKAEVAKLVQALRAVHDKGYLHNDICPANILVSTDASPRLLLADFGLAMPTDSDGVCVLDKFIGRHLYAADSVLRAKGGRTTYSRMTDLESLVKTMFALRHPSFVQAVLHGPDEDAVFDKYLEMWDRPAQILPALGKALAAARAGNYEFAALVEAWW